jgi:4-carboxymuconolactone decarboxylase
MRARIPLPVPAEMSAEQRRIHDDVLRTRPNASGPFLAWLHSPGLAQPAQALGAFCRYQTSLDLQESELLILCVAAAYRCPGEQQIHEPIARAAGLSEQVVAAIRSEAVAELPTARLRMLAEIARELCTTKQLGPALFRRAEQLFGTAALVEIVGVIGYYAFVAYTLNAFEMSPA